MDVYSLGITLYCLYTGAGPGMRKQLGALQFSMSLRDATGWHVSWRLLVAPGWTECPPSSSGPHPAGQRGPYEQLRLPYRDSLGKRVADPANPLRPEIPADMPPDFAGLLRACWAADAAARPAAAEVAARLVQMTAG